MRTAEGVVQDLGSPVVGYESGKDYSRGTNFTCMATTGALQHGSWRSLLTWMPCCHIAHGLACLPSESCMPGSRQPLQACHGSCCWTLVPGAWLSGQDSCSAPAAAGEGCIAVGSQDGQVRLYSDKAAVGTIAKTAIPGLGLPITAIAASYDGKWVLATTDKYLMVVNASFKVGVFPLKLVASFSAILSVVGLAHVQSWQTCSARCLQSWLTPCTRLASKHEASGGCMCRGFVPLGTAASDTPAGCAGQEVGQGQQRLPESHGAAGPQTSPAAPQGRGLHAGAGARICLC